MLVGRLQKFLTTPTTKLASAQGTFWFCLSLTFAVVFSLPALETAFSCEYVVQDDARQHVFWMQRFLDPGLFPNDLIADYFQSVAPPGYTALYQLAANLGINPLVFNKLLPVALGIIATAYCFGVCVQFLPVPAAGFVATLLLNHNLWLWDDLVSGTARAFVYPLFLAFLYYLLRRSLLPCLVVILLQGLVYPQFVFIIAGTLMFQLLRWENGLRLSRDRKDFIFCAAGLGTALLVMLPYALETSQFGPVITVAEAKALPEFLETGRTRFFVANPWEFWLSAMRTGAVLWIMPLCILSVFLLPILLRSPSRFPLARQVRNTPLLLQVALASLSLFFAAHALLFKLYLPSRYMHSSLQILTALTGGITVIVLLDSLFRWAEQPTQRHPYRRQILAVVSMILLGSVLVLSPILYDEFPAVSSYQVDQKPSLYKFFAQQPKEILIASIAKEADNIPTFSQRSVLVGREYSVPYHVGYYRQLRKRTVDLIQAQYSPNIAEVQTFIQTYGVDFWLIDRAYLQTPYVPTKDRLKTTLWIEQFQPVVSQARARAEQGATPALVNVLDRCSVFEAGDLVVLQATCITQES